MKTRQLLLICLVAACGKNAPDADSDWVSNDTDDDIEEDDGIDEDEDEPTTLGSGIEVDECVTAERTVLDLVPQDTNAVSTPVQARAAILAGYPNLPGIPIRSYEFLNYYEPEHDAAPAGELALDAQLALHDVDDQFVFHLALSSEERSNEVRLPVNLVVSIDASCSMSDDFDVAKESIYAMAASLREGDTFSLVTWDTGRSAVLEQHAVTGPDDDTIRDAVDRMYTDGATDLAHGLELAYEIAEAGQSDDTIDRVVLITDGMANVGTTETSLIARMAGERYEHGIHLVGVGLGEPLEFHDGMLDSVTDAGRGASLFVSDADEAWSLLHDDFVANIDVAALDVQLELDLPVGFQRVDHTPDPREDTPASEAYVQHLAPNRSLVMHQVFVTDCPDAATDDATVEATVRWYDPRDGRGPRDPRRPGRSASCSTAIPPSSTRARPSSRTPRPSSSTRPTPAPPRAVGATRPSTHSRRPKPPIPAIGTSPRSGAC